MNTGTRGNHTCVSASRLVAILLTVTMLLSSCFDELNLNEHGCEECLACEECIASKNGAFCQATSHVYNQCGQDGSVYWFNSCDVQEDLASECTHADCVNISSTEAFCDCHPNWGGDSCEQCIGNWDIEQDCLQCLGNWDISEDCNACANQWIDDSDNCSYCPGNWDPLADCNECQGDWDPAKNCEACLLAGDQGEPICGDGIVQDEEECDDCNNIDWDGCTQCQITEFQVNTAGVVAEGVSATAISNDGEFVIAWSDDLDGWGQSVDIWANIFSASDLRVREEFRVNANTTSTINSPVVAINDNGRISAAWANGSLGNFDADIYAQGLNGGGPLWSDDTVVGVGEDYTYFSFSTAMDSNGRLFVVWACELESVYSSIVMQIIGPNGGLVGELMQLSPVDDCSHTHPSMTMSKNGQSVVIWHRTNSTSESNLYARIFDENFAPIGPEIKVNTDFIQHHGYGSSVASDASGGFVVVWQGQETETNSIQSIWGQLFHPDGSKNGSVFKVNSYTGGDHTAPKVARSDQGDFIVVWEETDGWNGPPSGVYGRRFAANGDPIDPDYPICVHTNSAEFNPSIAMAPDGKHIVSWTSSAEDGSKHGIFAQRYDKDGNALGLLPWDYFE